jgi:hypothetical protein
MEIDVATEKAYVITTAFTRQQIRERAWDKKVQVFASGLGSLLSRPKPEEVEIIYDELRYEPFWHVIAGAHYRYTRPRSYRVAVGAPEVRRVTIDGRDYEMTAGKDNKEPRGFTLSGVEYCEEELRQEKFFDAVSGSEQDRSADLKHPASEIPDLSTFTPAESIVVAPLVRATTVVRGLIGPLFKSVQGDQMLEERVAVDAVDLYFKPTYAVEYHWKTKDKKIVAEFDGVTGDMRTGGRAVRDQLKHVLSQDLLFDVTADAVGMVVPGGSIAVKLARAGARKVMGE